MPRTLVLALTCLLLGPAVPQGGAQEPPVIRKDAGGEEEPPSPPEAPARPGPGQLRIGPGNVQGPTAAKPDPHAPRPRPARAPQPFHTDRPLLEVDGVAITSGELNELVAYYSSFRPGSTDLLLRDAVEALVPRAAVRARFADALPGMKERILQAKAALEAGEDFAAVVQRFSDDDEAPTPDGTYVFGREEAVQPFDMAAHTGKVGELQGPILTQYGYHLLEIVAYQQGLEPKEDRTTVRHVLVMFPFTTGDVRQEIRDLVDRCRIRILEPGLANILPPELRDQVVDEGS